MNWFTNRLKESSTWKGIAVILSIAGLTNSEAVSDMLVVVGPQLVEQVSVLITTVIGAWEVFRKEKKVEIPQIPD